MLCLSYEHVMFKLRYITCYVVMLYNMLCCVMFILRYRTYNV